MDISSRLVEVQSEPYSPGLRLTMCVKRGSIQCWFKWRHFRQFVTWCSSLWRNKSVYTNFSHMQSYYQLYVAKLCRLSPLMSCSRGPTGSWRGLQSGVCGPTRPNSAPGQAGLLSPPLNTPEWLLSAWLRGAAANGCFQALKASWKHQRGQISTILVQIYTEPV